MKDVKADVGVIIGRFQVDKLHEGHIDLFDQVYKNHSRLIVVLGLSHGKCTVSNPLDFQSRKAMVQELYPDATIIYVKDVHDDQLWSNDLDERILDILGPEQTACLYGSRDSFIPYYKGQFPTEEISPSIAISGTEIRKRLASSITNSSDWRAGACWAMANQWPKPMFTIDVAILNKDCTKILLGRKAREANYRFVGGFVGNCESLEETVAREAMEEASVELSDISYIASVPIDDWRYRSERDKITTTFFVAKVADGIPKAGDDIVEVRWFNIADIFQNEERYLDADMSGIVGNHEILMDKLLDYLATH